LRERVNAFDLGNIETWN